MTTRRPNLLARTVTRVSSPDLRAYCLKVFPTIGFFINPPIVGFRFVKNAFFAKASPGRVVSRGKWGACCPMGVGSVIADLLNVGGSGKAADPAYAIRSGGVHTRRFAS